MFPLSDIPLTSGIITSGQSLNNKILMHNNHSIRENFEKSRKNSSLDQPVLTRIQIKYTINLHLIYSLYLQCIFQILTLTYTFHITLLLSLIYTTSSTSPDTNSTHIVRMRRHNIAMK